MRGSPPLAVQRSFDEPNEAYVVHKKSCCPAPPCGGGHPPPRALAPNICTSGSRHREKGYTVVPVNNRLTRQPEARDMRPGFRSSIRSRFKCSSSNSSVPVHIASHSCMEPMNELRNPRLYHGLHLLILGIHVGCSSAIWSADDSDSDMLFGPGPTSPTSARPRDGSRRQSIPLSQVVAAARVAAIRGCTATIGGNGP